MTDALRSGVSRRVFCGALGAATLSGVAGLRPARAGEAASYLFPAPPVLPAFGPIQLAKGRGYFEKAGLDMNFMVGRGGVDVAQQVGAGNATVGGIVADGPILVRGNGIPVKIVCVFGGRGFMQMVVREDSGVTKPADLKGKTITVMSYQDTTYYALLGLLASAGLTKADVNIQSAGPTGVWQLVAAGKAAGMAGVPDWIPPIRAENVPVTILQTEDYFPHMAQGIATSDEMIKKRPDLVQKIVRAALQGMKDIMDDPAGAAADFVKFVPSWQGKEAAIKWTFEYYAKNVYTGQKKLGEVDGTRLAKLQDFYLKNGIVQNKVTVDDLYTNQFIG